MIPVLPVRFTPSWQMTVPLLGGFMGFVIGHLTDSFFISASAFLLFLFAISKSFVVRELAPLLVVLGISSVFFWGAIWRLDSIAPRYDSVALIPDWEISIQGTIVDYRGREDRTQLILNDIQYGEDARTDDLLLTLNRPLADWQVGDRLAVSCDASFPEEGSYANYLRAQGIYKTCETFEEPIYLSRAVTPAAIAWQLRENFNELVRSRLAEPHATLLTGLYIGDVYFSRQYSEIFKVTGISHIVAASGANVTLTVVLMIGLLAALGVRRQDMFPWILLSIFAFVVLSGMSAPVIRAGVMGVIVLLGITSGRKVSMRNALLLAVVGILFVKPLWLFYDVGFQLSVVSTWGLLAMSDYFKRLFSFVPELLGLQEALSTTMAATLATAPILILSFGQFSFLSPIANLLILPALPYILLSGAVVLILPELSFLTALPWLGLEWTLRISDFLSTLSVAHAQFDTMWVRLLVSFFFVCLMVLILRNEYLRSRRSL